MNIMIAQSGGPTPAINATAVGIIELAGTLANIDKVYGALNGIEGVVHDHVIDLSERLTSDVELEMLFYTPASALGACRHRLPENIADDPLYPQIIQNLMAKEVELFIYIGGNDSMDTVKKLSQYCALKGIDSIRFIGAPKTIDNDLEGTDHCPGFGSAAKYIATTFAELEKDCTVYNQPSVTIVEVMGRNTGWLTASSALSRLNGGRGPDLIYLCELPFDQDKFLTDLTLLLTEGRPILVAVSEGVKKANGDYISVIEDNKLDAFGHQFISGSGKYLENLVRNRVGGKVRSIELNLMQRCAGHISSKTDLEESRQIGRYALQIGLTGETGKMVGIQRVSSHPYQIEFVVSDIDQIANAEKKVPLAWIMPSKSDVTCDMIDYLKPLIAGETALKYRNGIPDYISLH